jgi:hypothetical protein
VAIRVTAACFLAASWLLVGIFAILFPGADNQAAAVAWGPAWAIPVVGGLAGLGWLALARRDAPPGRGITMAASLVIQIAMAIAAGLLVHRDFLSLPFQLVVIHYALLLETAPRMRSRLFTDFAVRFYSFTLAIVAFFLIWIALMGYAIATRSEPRWLPSIAYNIFNLGLCCFLYLANLGLRRKSMRELVVKDGCVLLDGLDITGLFSPSALPLACRLLAAPPGNRLTCREALGLTGREDCGGDCDKATNCAGYKYVYNRVHELKRVCQALKIGQIIDPDDRRRILVEGWEFHLDPAVSLEDRA